MKIQSYTKDYILGDTHAEWGRLNQFMDKKKPRNVYICGDFGWWPGHKGYDISLIKNKETKIYFCDGNHENHEDLERLRKLYPFAMSLNTPIEVAHNIYYCPRGTIKILDDGRKMLFFGGASSVDKQWRTPGYDWFSGEDIKPNDLDQIDNIGKIDIVISHTCPESFLPKVWSKMPVGMWDKNNDSACGYLEWILENNKPDRWYFGHFHVSVTEYKKGCRWTLLNRCAVTNWFTELK